MGLTIAPPPYLRTPYLIGSGASTGDVVIPETDRQAWFRGHVIVEEKLDGANVAVWLGEHDRLQVAGRGGVDGMDRAGQLGRLRAWCAKRLPDLTALLAGELVAYGEWLWLEHSVPYDRLPDLLIFIDLWSPSHGFLPVDERDRRSEAHGFVSPPRLFEGVLGSRERLDALFGRSAFGSADAEGLVLRRSPTQRCKILAPGFRRRSDEEWLRHRRYNHVLTDPSEERLDA